MVLDQLAKPRRDARVVQTRRRKLLARRPPQWTPARMARAHQPRPAARRQRSVGQARDAGRRRSWL